MIATGNYVGRALPGKTFYDETEKGQMRVVVNLALRTDDDPLVGDVAVFLYFSEKAKPYSVQKLQALGFNGNWDTLETQSLDNDVDVAVTYETYEGKERIKADIRAGGGGFVPRSQMDGARKRQFLAELKAALPKPVKSLID